MTQDNEDVKAPTIPLGLGTTIQTIQQKDNTSQQFQHCCTNKNV